MEPDIKTETSAPVEPIELKTIQLESTDMGVCDIEGNCY